MAEMDRIKDELSKMAAVNEERAVPQGQAMRQNARNALGDLLARKKQQVHNFEALLDALPAKLPPAADQALWDLVMGALR